MKISTPTKNVRGLGSAKEGVQHFWRQRVTAVALIPLLIWFMSSIVAHVGADYAEIQAYLAQPLTAVLMLLFLGAGFYHMRLGIQVIIEDYIHKPGTKVALLLLNDFAAAAIGLACVFSVLKIALAS